MTRLIENQQDLAKWVQAQDGNLDIAVAFWGKGAIEMLGLAKRKRDLRIILDLSSGASHPEEVEALRALSRCKVKSVEKFHAKSYLSDTEMVVGSANASRDGLAATGSAKSRWHELAMLSSDPKIVHEGDVWFERKWLLASKITDEDMVVATEKWWIKQRSRPLPDANGRDLLTAAIEDPDGFRNRGLNVAVALRDLSPKGKKTLHQIEKQVGHVVYAFEDWANIPTEQTILSFLKYKKDKDFHEDGIYYSGVKQHSALKLVTVSRVHGYKLGSIFQWRKCLQRAEEDDPVTWRKIGGICMDLGEFAERFGKD